MIIRHNTCRPLRHRADPVAVVAMKPLTKLSSLHEPEALTYADVLRVESANKLARRTENREDLEATDE